jgi:hypothetical protein
MFGQVCKIYNLKPSLSQFADADVILDPMLVPILFVLCMLWLSLELSGSENCALKEKIGIPSI